MKETMKKRNRRLFSSQRSKKKKKNFENRSQNNNSISAHQGSIQKKEGTNKTDAFFEHEAITSKNTKSV